MNLKRHSTAIMLLSICTFIFMPTRAEDAAYRYYVDISETTIEQLDQLFMTLKEDLGNSEASDPLVVVLHGDEAGAFLRSNYTENRSVVDTAALLDAYGVIDVKMCATWMRTHAITERDIPPFIETVPFGPAEVQRLRNAGFSSAAKVKL